MITEPLRFPFRGALALVLVASLGACKRGEAPPPEAPSLSPLPLPAPDRYDKFIAYLRAKGADPKRIARAEANAREGRIRDEQEVFDRLELVTRAAPDFKPVSGRKRLRLHLEVEKARMRVGEDQRFAFSITNLGSTTYYQLDRAGSLFKSGSPSASPGYYFFLTTPDGKTGILTKSPAMSGGIAPEIHFPKGMTPEQIEAEIERRMNKGAAKLGLYMHLQPGETLNMRGDGPGERFRTYRLHIRLDSSGRYCLLVVFNQAGFSMTDAEFKRYLIHGLTRELVLIDHEKKDESSVAPSESERACFEVLS